MFNVMEPVCSIFALPRQGVVRICTKTTKRKLLLAVTILLGKDNGSKNYLNACQNFKLKYFNWFYIWADTFSNHVKYWKSVGNCRCYSMFYIPMLICKSVQLTYLRFIDFKFLQWYPGKTIRWNTPIQKLCHARFSAHIFSLKKQTN